jgi:hypothetical protein
MGGGSLRRMVDGGELSKKGKTSEVVDERSPVVNFGSERVSGLLRCSSKWSRGWRMAGSSQLW